MERLLLRRRLPLLDLRLGEHRLEREQLRQRLAVRPVDGGRQVLLEGELISIGVDVREGQRAELAHQRLDQPRRLTLNLARRQHDRALLLLATHAVRLQVLRLGERECLGLGTGAHEPRQRDRLLARAREELRAVLLAHQPRRQLQWRLAVGDEHHDGCNRVVEFEAIHCALARRKPPRAV
eukprot:8532-Prymnesium_polylepis.2